MFGYYLQKAFNKKWLAKYDPPPLKKKLKVTFQIGWSLVGSLRVEIQGCEELAKKRSWDLGQIRQDRSYWGTRQPAFDFLILCHTANPGELGYFKCLTNNVLFERRHLTQYDSQVDTFPWSLCSNYTGGGWLFKSYYVSSGGEWLAALRFDEEVTPPVLSRGDSGWGNRVASESESCEKCLTSLLVLRSGWWVKIHLCKAFVPGSMVIASTVSGSCTNLTRSSLTTHGIVFSPWLHFILIAEINVPLRPMWVAFICRAVGECDCPVSLSYNSSVVLRVKVTVDHWLNPRSWPGLRNVALSSNVAILVVKNS